MPEFLPLMGMTINPVPPEVEMMENAGKAFPGSVVQSPAGIHLVNPVWYVEAMGGRLRLVVEFPNHPAVMLGGLGDTEDAPRKAG